MQREARMVMDRSAKPGRRVYGGVIDYIRDKARFLVLDHGDDPLVTIFHYDWRKSNVPPWPAR
jgi:hypothetical protein